jgi:hypothetical protein
MPGAEGAPLEAGLRERLSRAFGQGSGHGLLLLGADETATPLPPALAYWREFGARFVTRLCAQPEGDFSGAAALPAPPGAEELEWLAMSAPPMTGGEYLDGAVLDSLWGELAAAFERELAEAGCGVQEFLKRRNPAWNLVGRVHFNLAENRKDPASPFAFLATYTTRLSANARAQHVPLGQALREYAGAENRDRLLSLLLPVQRAAALAPWLKAMVDSGEIYHPLRWTPREALQMLRDVPQLESAGVVLRMPATWRGNRPGQPRVTGAVGGRPPARLGQDSMLDFRMEVTLDGEALTEAEIRQLLAQSDGLALVRGRWVEVDRDRLARTIERFGSNSNGMPYRNGISFGDAMRLLVRADVAGDREEEAVAEGWAEVKAGPWLAETLKALRSPQGIAASRPWRRSEGRAAPLPGDRRAVAEPCHATWVGGVPGRRHGSRQDHTGSRCC